MSSWIAAKHLVLKITSESIATATAAGTIPPPADASISSTIIFLEGLVLSFPKLETVVFRLEHSPGEIMTALDYIVHRLNQELVQDPWARSSYVEHSLVVPDDPSALSWTPSPTYKKKHRKAFSTISGRGERFRAVYGEVLLGSEVDGLVEHAKMCRMHR